MRKDKGGGGIAIGVRPSLEPTWVNEGYKATETLSVVINVEKRKIRMFVGYGSQNVASDEVKINFGNICLMMSLKLKPIMKNII